MSRQNGSAIFIILIAVALFGALAYAFTQSSRGNTGMITDEADKAKATQGQDCANDIAMAAKRLTLRGCAQISYNSDGTNDDPSAPADGSCAIFHINGGGLSNCAATTGCSDTELAALAIGANCGGIVYAGISPDGGKRMYTTAASTFDLPWDTGSHVDTAMANCTGTSGGTCNTGKANTALLAALGGRYGAASFCDALIYGGRDDWYLPALAELIAMNPNGDAIGGLDMTGGWTSGYYWSSTEDNTSMARDHRFSPIAWEESRPKEISLQVRCVRRVP